MTEEIKVLAFIICLKRFKRNSVIFKIADYKMAQRMGIHPTTFKKYLKISIDNNFIKDNGSSYSIIQMESIIKKFKGSLCIRFGKHLILESNNFKYSNVLDEIYECVLVDNLILKQEYAIKKKIYTKDLQNRFNSTGKVKITVKEIKRYKQLLKTGQICAGEIINVNEGIITSARHTSSILGVSTSKANKILNNLKSYKRSINVIWKKGVNKFNIELMRSKFPQAKIIPMLHYDMIKVCFGSELMKI
jgi:hypothetical protein